MKKFAATLSSAQYVLARRFEAAKLTTISQAVKAFERRDNEMIEYWKNQLKEKEA
jgi:hypothetical protein